MSGTLTRIAMAFGGIMGQRVPEPDLYQRMQLIVAETDDAVIGAAAQCLRLKAARAIRDHDSMLAAAAELGRLLGQAKQLADTIVRVTRRADGEPLPIFMCCENDADCHKPCPSHPWSTP